MTEENSQKNKYQRLTANNSFGLTLTLWLAWLLLQIIVQACISRDWTILIIYIVQLYGFFRLVEEDTEVLFKQRLSFWLKLFLIFFYGKGFVFIFNVADSILFGTLSPTKLLVALIPFIVESVFILKLNQKPHQTLEPQRKARLIIDERTGEIRKEMS